MPVAKVRGVNIFYQVIGDRGPWAALITGGRRGHDEFVPLATKLANAGYRVVLHDRRNTGRSDVLIEGDVAEEILWLDDLHELLKQLNAIPTFVGGSSAGARTAMRYYVRFRNDVRGLLLMRVTGGAFAAGRLPENYYGQFIKAAQQGGMAAVCATEQYQERIAANPQTRDRLMAMDPKQYIKVMSNWQDQFIASTKTGGVRHDRRRPRFDLGPDRRHPRQRPDPRLGERPHCGARRFRAACCISCRSRIRRCR